MEAWLRMTVELQRSVSARRFSEFFYCLALERPPRHSTSEAAARPSDSGGGERALCQPESVDDPLSTQRSGGNPAAASFTCNYPWLQLSRPVGLMSPTLGSTRVSEWLRYSLERGRR